MFRIVELNDYSNWKPAYDCDGGRYSYGKIFKLQGEKYLVEYWNSGSCGFDYCHKTGDWTDCYHCIWYNRNTGECEFAGEFITEEKLREEINEFFSRGAIVEVEGDTLRLTIPKDEEE